MPITVQITSDEPQPRTLDLQIVQYDGDGDEVVFARPGITVNSGTQQFSACFLPETINGGLPAVGTNSAAELEKRLRIFLAEPDTGRRIAQVATAGLLPQALESGQNAGPRGQKLIVVVGRSPNVNEFAPGADRVAGMAEDVLFVQVEPRRLPETATAYQSVDAVTWTDADPTTLSAAQWRALIEYVRLGGTLVIPQNADRSRLARFDDLLPVRVASIEDWSSLTPLRDMLTPPNTPFPTDSDQHTIDPWERVAPPFRMARAEALPDAWVDDWIIWPDGTQSPYIARHLLGAGSVNWIAQDISDRSITRADFGWPRLWERLMHWHDSELKLPPAETQAERDRLRDRFDAGVIRDLGVSFLAGLDLQSKRATLITVAVLFFVGYWILAGPGAYLFLSARKQTELSWFVFGTIALAATLLTVLVSQIVLRGSPQARHVTLIRATSGGSEPASVATRLGIYVPRDERAEIALNHPALQMPADLAPLAVAPRYARQEVRPRDTQYNAAIRPSGSDNAVATAIPFRSTLKKLQSRWGRTDAPQLSGALTLLPEETPISGRLSNNSGVELSNVLMVFRSPNQPGRDLFLARGLWKSGKTLDLAEAWKKADAKPIPLASHRLGMNIHDLTHDARGPWEYAENWLYEDLRRGLVTAPTWDDSDRGYARSFPLVSFFDCCTPMSNLANENSRVDLFRRGVRDWDLSPAIACGALVVIAQAQGPLPPELAVDGTTPAGSGQYFYQFVVPMDLTRINQPPPPPSSTQPTTQPTTAP